MYKLSGMNEHFVRFSLCAFLDCMAENGIRDIELWAGMPHLYAPDADALLERLAVGHRATETVVLVSSDFAIRGTSGQEVRTVSSRTFLLELRSPTTPPETPGSLAGRLDEATRARLERLRRGRE